ncbi:cilia- and flagella-associated protein 206 isoform X2 [Stomoxys calcitrans]|uniref:cilia- and flagella-associated protein 206 isoform X2 n=1 Tax=Stomoxys calcitrans TaxID=35570 RepID=UPI0027E21DAA|nr:cilia- and flagella-associated protein 206 isoform X2 [Stomoxys calcitrans]
MNYTFINVRDFLPDFLQELSKGHVPKKLGDYLLRLIFKSHRIKGKEGDYYLKSAPNKPKSDLKPFITIDDLVPHFIDECEQNFMSIDRYFGSYLLHILIRDLHDGLPKASQFTIGKLDRFLRKCLDKYAQPFDPTICNMKICYYAKNCLEIDFEYAKKKYELNAKEKLSKLIAGILQYPETSNPKQLEEMFVKMQVFIITNFNIGCPQNAELLKQTRQSLNSVLGKGDLQKYVLKKRYHRLDYLQRLSSTVCGIVTFNNYKQQKNKDNHNLEMAQNNTKDALDEGLKRASMCIQKGTRIMQSLIRVDTVQQKVQYFYAAAKTREINKFVILFLVYRRHLERIKGEFEKTQSLIEVTQKKFKCVIDKISDIIKHRSAIETDVIFPHFVYLSNVWLSLVLHLNHLTEINKLKDHLDELLNENMENHYHSICDATKNFNKFCAMEASFHELMFVNSEVEGKLDPLKTQNFLKDYCAFTLALTNGLLVPSQVERKLSQNMDITFGFANINVAQSSEEHLSLFFSTFKHVIFNSADMVLLFELEGQIIRQDVDLVRQIVSNNKDSSTQTESGTLLSGQNKMENTWNVWDYHRKTIALANVRKKQTNSTQTIVSSGKRNSQNQCSGDGINQLH